MAGSIGRVNCAFKEERISNSANMHPYKKKRKKAWNWFNCEPLLLTLVTTCSTFVFAKCGFHINVDLDFVHIAWRLNYLAIFTEEDLLALTNFAVAESKAISARISIKGASKSRLKNCK